MSAAAATLSSPNLGDPHLVRALVSSVAKSGNGNGNGNTSSLKILTKLIENALTKGRDDEKFRKVRLGNPKVEKALANAGPGALPLLLGAGFSKVSVDGEELLLFDGSSKRGEMAAREVLRQLEAELEAELAALEEEEEKKNDHPSSALASNAMTGNSSSGGGPFLSEEERAKRQEEAKMKRKARQREKQLALAKFRQDKADRDEMSAIQTAAKQAAISVASAVAAAPPSSGSGGGGGAAVSPYAPGPNVTIKKRHHGGQEKEAAPLPPSSSPVGPGAKDKVACPEAAAPASASGGDDDKGEPMAVCDVGGGGDAAQKLAGDPAAAAVAAKCSGMSVDDVDVTMETAPGSAGDEVTMETAPGSAGDEEDDEEIAKFFQRIPRCAGADGIRETSIYWRKSAHQSSNSSPKCLRKLLRELDGMKDNGEGGGGGTLPGGNNRRCGIWVRFDEEAPQYIRAVIASALPGPSPYSGGLFCFDVYIPGDYPNIPPKVTLLNTGGGTVRFGPNLYADGKVCLSLLGTWPGPKWQPGLSNIAQVLISIQGMLLGEEHPFFLEPGFFAWEGSVKPGDFTSKGFTLSGEMVTEDIRLPAQAALYEDSLRVGTIRFAMVEMLDSLPPASSSVHLRYLQPFQLPILAHFYYNREDILSEVKGWMMIDRKMASTAASSSKCLSSLAPMNALQQHDSSSLDSRLDIVSGQIKKLFPALESKLRALQEPNLPEKTAAKMAPPAAPVRPKNEDDYEDDFSSSSTNDQKALTQASSDDIGGGSGNKQEDPLVHLKSLMQEAAGAGDYVKAGKVQADIKAIEELKQSMKEAADEGNFIRAGKLQEQLYARFIAIKDLPAELHKQSATMKDLIMKGKKAATSATATTAPMVYSDEDEDDSVDGVEISGMPGGFPGELGPGGILSGMMQGGKGPKGWHLPAGYQTRVPNPNHQWIGEGKKLVAEPQATEACDSMETDSKPPPNKPRSGVPCRLRIRLPNSKVLTEEFDAAETISSVYRRIDPHVRSQGGDAAGNAGSTAPVATKAKRTQIMTPYGPAVVEQPAFSQSLSCKGYTLLLAHPKREFSFEVHGTKSLRDMDLVPSASLTVFKCNERGVVRRGDLEARLGEAQGDAMDIEGLSYEGLQELTERVGVKTTTWSLEDEQKLAQNSILLRPSEYLKSDSSATCRENADDVSALSTRCAICLSDFDVTDSEPTLRKLKTCRHQDNIFHESCIRTWIQTSTSCPICKAPLLE